MIDCPECALPAEVVDRFWLASTSGPVEHVSTRCVAGHRLTPRSQDLEAGTTNPRSAPRQLRIVEPPSLEIRPIGGDIDGRSYPSRNSLPCGQSNNLESRQLHGKG